MTQSAPKRINLALQGGGAHGAFTWGVLDRLLEEPGLEIAGISGTSAGALNGAALKAGLVRGGRQAARENLDWLWAQIGAATGDVLSDWMGAVAPAAGLIAKTLENSAQYLWADTAGRLISPYAYGPFYQNPLAQIVEDFHFDEVCSADGPAFCICATNVRTGKIKVFRGTDISKPAILASACLPTLFQAVEITDPETGVTEAYWDGGYTGNPALYPLFDPDLPQDILVININPLRRDTLPKTPQDIQNRINEISFNSSLLRELRAISFVHRLMQDQVLTGVGFKDVLVHMIADDALMQKLSVATKLIPQAPVLRELRDAGRQAADTFLNAHYDDLNQRSTVNLVEMFG